MAKDISSIPDPRNPAGMALELAGVTPPKGQVADLFLKVIHGSNKSTPPYMIRVRISYEVYLKTETYFWGLLKREIWVRQSGVLRDGFFIAPSKVFKRQWEMEQELKSKAKDNIFKRLHNIKKNIKR